MMTKWSLLKWIRLRREKESIIWMRKRVSSHKLRAWWREEQFCRALCKRHSWCLKKRERNTLISLAPDNVTCFGACKRCWLRERDWCGGEITFITGAKGRFVDRGQLSRWNNRHPDRAVWVVTLGRSRRSAFSFNDHVDHLLASCLASDSYFRTGWTSPRCSGRCVWYSNLQNFTARVLLFRRVYQQGDEWIAGYKKYLKVDESILSCIKKAESHFCERDKVTSPHWLNLSLFFFLTVKRLQCLCVKQSKYSCYLDARWAFVSHFTSSREFQRNFICVCVSSCDVCDAMSTKWPSSSFSHKSAAASSASSSYIIHA